MADTETALLARGAGAHIVGDGRYLVNDEPVLLSGTQAILRLILAQKRRDQAAGFNTAGFVSGYRGSPLGGVDQALLRASATMTAHDIVFRSGLNEEIAATALLGSQQIGLFGDGTRDGVFGLWYAKGPGVDRSGDALRHGNLAGSSALGGALILAGDDHVCKSSTTSHQSEFALMDAMIPILNPSNIADILEFGLHGWALSRFAGCWASLKLAADIVDTTASLHVGNEGAGIRLPVEFALPRGGLGIRWPDTPQQQEERLHALKLPAAQAYVRANLLDRRVLGDGQARIGIVTTGKSYADVRQALEGLGIDDATAARIGLALFKVAMVWPLEPTAAQAFCEGLDLVVVIEEKRALIESQLRDLLYHLPADRRPRIIGKRDEQGAPLFVSHGELTPRMIASALAERIAPLTGDPALRARIAAASILEIRPTSLSSNVQRTAYFCSGCPHSSSTKVPDGSRAMAGIGCHWMAQSMDRNTATAPHMGSEGANWIGQAPFSTTPHIFQNIGDGTYFHSGSLAIRAAVAAGVNMTYKILFNDAVAMTGGQSHDGALTPQVIADQVRAEGVERIAVVSDDIEKYRHQRPFVTGTTVHHRHDLDSVQRELRAVTGVSVLIYDQVCAAEKRRRIKRGTLPKVQQRLLINPGVCEGCGDCSRTSNCVSVVPLDTALGTKRSIDQSSCNTDFSCLDGFCPSFVSVTGATAALPAQSAHVMEKLLAIPLPDIAPAALQQPHNIMITGIGGTGVVTIGAILAAAAHIQGYESLSLDMAGMAQKGGAVTTHLQIAAQSSALHQSRITPAALDLLLGCDAVVAAGPEAMAVLKNGRTKVVVNHHETITGTFTRNPAARIPVDKLIEQLSGTIGEGAVRTVAASRIAAALLGDAIAGNLFLVGYAYQNGLLPLRAEAILLAIQKNGAAVKLNTSAFRLGRLAAHDMAIVVDAAGERDNSIADLSNDALIAHRERLLTDYQHARYARDYRQFVDNVRARSAAVDHDGLFLRSVAVSLAQLMAYKDEYEVARLHRNPEFLGRLRVGGGRVHYHLAPPLLAKRDPVTGHPRKMRFGSWINMIFAVLVPMRRLRGTAFDVFGFTAERRAERALIDEYRTLIEGLLSALSPDNIVLAVDIAAAAQDIRGFGHVKAGNIAKVRSHWAALQKRFSTTEGSKPV